MPGYNEISQIPIKKVKRAIMSNAENAKTSHTHGNKSVLDKLSQVDLDKINASYYRLVSLATLLGIEFDANGNVEFSTDTNVLPYFLVDDNNDDLVDSSGNYLYL